MVSLILLVAAFVLAIIEACSPYFTIAPKRPNLGWLAIALYFLSILLGKV